MQGSYFIPKEKFDHYLKTKGGMFSQEGIFLYGISDPGVAKLLPPPLELTDPENPLFYLYIVDIREPTFAPWYMEGGLGVLAKYKDKVGVYFFGLMLSGPGALMGAFTGREGSGLPKKLCERIVVERTDEYAHCFIERGGTRLMDVELEIGQYNQPDLHMPAEGCEKVADGILETDGGCLLHRYRKDGNDFSDMELIFYNSPNRFHTWEPATATVKLASTLSDPWGEIPLVQVLGAAWSKCDNWVDHSETLYKYPKEDALDTMQYLFTGRYDRSMLCKNHQHSI